MTEGPAPIDLIRHPASPGLGVLRVQARLRRTASGGLDIDYTVRGAIAGLRIPAPREDAAPRREDGLWRRTCLEVFLRGEGDTHLYREFNFSPAGAWQGYGFHAYREGAALRTECTSRSPGSPKNDLPPSGGGPGFAGRGHTLSSRSPGSPKNDLPPPGGGPGVFPEPGAEHSPAILSETTPGELRLTARLPAGLIPAGPLRAALAAVIESRDGRLAYWALHHPKAQPDFHHADAFTLELP